MKTNTLFQVRFRPSVKPPRGFTKSAHYNVLSYDWHNHKYLIGNTWLPASYFIKIEVEDAPVFQKPPFRKIASLKPDDVIECNTDAELKAVLEQAEREGLKWIDGIAAAKYIPKTHVFICNRATAGGRRGLTYYHGSLLEGDTALPASKFVEVAAEAKGVIEDLPTGKQLIQSHIDAQFEKPAPAPELKPFPEGYVIPEGTRVVALTDGGYSEKTCREGDVGTVMSERSIGGGYVQFDGRAKGGWVMRYKELAPLDPRDHPEHPEFGKNKQEEPITQAQKDECRKIDDGIFQNPFSNQGELLERNNQLTGQIETMKRLAKIALSNEDYEHMRVILRAIANGEI